VSVEEEWVVWLLGSEFSWKGYEIVVVGKWGYGGYGERKSKWRESMMRRTARLWVGGNVHRDVGSAQDTTIERDSLLST